MSGQDDPKRDLRDLIAQHPVLGIVGAQVTATDLATPNPPKEFLWQD